MIDVTTESRSIDLVVDQVYGGSRNGDVSDDPLPKLLGVDNRAGFRHLGQRRQIETLKMVVLKSSGKELDWPDSFDPETGIFTYYGDRRTPGDLHATPRQGNLILKNLFDAAHDESFISHFPPIFLFQSTGVYRDVKFLGLAVPGSDKIPHDSDLVALWRSTGPQNLRFQNYRAKFTVLDVPVVSREWIKDVQSGVNVSSKYAPENWVRWVKERSYCPLVAPRTSGVRTRQQQLPSDAEGGRILKSVYLRFADNPIAFESCALELARLMMPDVISADLTRPWRDGGRDAVGLFRIGEGESAIEVDFALEAKCYAADTSVGVKPLSRLLSRLRHRQFGILVTTSYLGKQAYEELREDQHPVVVVAGRDIVDVLRTRVGNKQAIGRWLDNLPVNEWL